MVNYDIPWIERTLPTIVYNVYVSIHVPLTVFPRCRPDRPHPHFFPRMKLILRDVGAQTSLQDSFSGYTPRHFPLPPSLCPKIIRNGHEKDVRGWLLSVAIVVSVISRLYIPSSLVSSDFKRGGVKMFKHRDEIE